MTDRLFESASDFIWRNARLLDRQRFAFHFLDREKSAVLAALRAYQNADGGFGNALEPDSRCPDSTPLAVMTTFYILDELDAFDDPLVLRACDYLETITTEAGGIPFTVPAINNYPHTPWMGTDDDNPPASINPTADIAGLLLKHKIEHPWLEKAVPFCWQAQDPSREGFHDIMPAVQFLINTPDQERAAPILEAIKDTIQKKKLVVFDRNTEGYVKFPLDWAPSPQHFFHSLFSEQQIIDDQQALIAAQQEGGGWMLNWPPVSTASEAEWRGIKTLENLLVLKDYGKI